MPQPFDSNDTKSAPSSVLHGAADAPDVASTKEPSVVQGARILCLISLLPLGLLALITASGLSDKRAQGPMVGYCGAMALVLLLFVGLTRRSSIAWYVQVVISVLGLLGVPIGTVIYGLILSRWFKPEVKVWFGV